MVAIPEVGSNAPDLAYNVANLKYDHLNNSYTCPQGKTLYTNGSWYNKERGKNRSSVKTKHYKTKDCLSCSVMALCTKNKKGRVIERTEYAPYRTK